MIKRIIACLTICLIITGLIDPVFSDASALPQPNWSDPGISEIINISDLTGWMLNGGTYDVSTYTDAESFMNDYFAARTKTRLEGSDYKIKSFYGLEEQYYESGDSAYTNPLDINRVIASSYRDHSGYGRRLSNEVNDALLSSGSLYDTKIPLLNEVEFANFVGYNHDALRLYSEFFTFEAPEQPVPNPDPNYQNLLDFINSKSGDPNSYNWFWFYNKDINSANVRQLINFADYSWVYYEGFPSANIPSTFNSSNSFWAFPTPIRDLNIVSTGNGNYTFADYPSNNTIICSQWNNGGWKDLYSLTIRYNQYTVIDFQTSYSKTKTSTGNLNTVLNYIKDNYKNVNIYVDGVPWAIVNTPSIPPHITPEFPDAVGGEELPNTTWPISRPRAPYYTSVPGILQAIEDAIQGDGELGIDDLKPYLTDANGDPVPDPIFDPEPVPIPVPDPVNPDVVPGLPVLPAIPLDMPGFNGVSVLAEIINFTNQSLPTSLIVTFWGVVFGIVILGLIKILHK